MAKKILITDDQRDLVEAIQLRFEKEGYEVITAFDGMECVSKAQSERPDLIIMDIAMPMMDGYSAVKAIKADKALRHIPIIVLTGKDQMEDLFKMEGIQEYVVKPFDYEELLTTVKKLLSPPDGD